MLKTKAKAVGAAFASSFKTSITPDQINENVRNKAQELYEKSGRKPGRDLENWLEAERIVKKQARA